MKIKDEELFERLLELQAQQRAMNRTILIALFIVLIMMIVSVVTVTNSKKDDLKKIAESLINQPTETFNTFRTHLENTKESEKFQKFSQKIKTEKSPIAKAALENEKAFYLSAVKSITEKEITSILTEAGIHQDVIKAIADKEKSRIDDYYKRLENYTRHKDQEKTIKSLSNSPKIISYFLETTINTYQYDGRRDE